MRNYTYVIVGGGMTADAAVEGIREVEGIDADSPESRFEALEAAERSGPERFPAGHHDEAVVRHEPQGREDVPFVEAHRRDQRAVAHRLTRRGVPCPVLASRSVAGRPPGPKAG